MGAEPPEGMGRSSDPFEKGYWEMSASDTPYHLRSGKFADRALFVELLRILERWSPLDDYAYISMGGYTMSDHVRVLKVLGINNLISFDLDENTVARASFNRPTEKTFVKRATAEDIATKLDELMDAWEVPKCSGRIVWFDFTTPKRLQNDLVSFSKLVASSSPGDILRITLNAEPANLPVGRSTGEEVTIEEQKTRKLKSVLQEADFDGEDPNDYEKLPRILARAVGRICSTAVGKRHRCSCLSSVTYSDGTQMLSVTLAVTAQPSDANSSLSISPHTKAKLDQWPLASKTWDEIHRLSIQTLTSRERAHLERHFPLDNPESVLDSLGFSVFGTISDPAGYLKKYGRLIRFYPDFVSST